jgi:hypothetical protein
MLPAHKSLEEGKYGVCINVHYAYNERIHVYTYIYSLWVHVLLRTFLNIADIRYMDHTILSITVLNKYFIRNYLKVLSLFMIFDLH